MSVVVARSKGKLQAHQSHKSHRLGYMSLSAVSDLVGEHSGKEVLIVLDDREQPGVEEDIGGGEHKAVDIG